eukprot:403353930
MSQMFDIKSRAPYNKLNKLVDYSNDQYLLAGRLYNDTLTSNIPFISATQQDPDQLKLQFTITVRAFEPFATDIQQIGDLVYDPGQDVIFAVTTPELLVIRISDPIALTYSFAQMFDGTSNYNCGACTDIQLVYRDGGATFPDLPFLYLAFYTQSNIQYNAVRFYSENGQPYSLIQDDNTIEGIQFDYTGIKSMKVLIDDEFWMITLRSDTNGAIDLIQMWSNDLDNVQQSIYYNVAQTEILDYQILKKFTGYNGYSGFRGCIKLNWNGYHQLGFLTLDYEESQVAHQTKTYELGMRYDRNECLDYLKQNLNTNYLLVRAVDTSYLIQYVLLRLDIEPFTKNPIGSGAFILNLQAQNSLPLANSFLKSYGKFIGDNPTILLLGSLDFNGRIVSMIVTNEPSKSCNPTEVFDQQPSLELAFTLVFVHTSPTFSYNPSESLFLTNIVQFSSFIMIYNDGYGILDNKQTDEVFTFPISQNSTFQFSYRLPSYMTEFENMDLQTTMIEDIDSGIPNEFISLENNGLLLNYKFSPTILNLDQTYLATITSSVSFYYIFNERIATQRPLNYVPLQDINVQNWRLTFEQDVYNCSTSGNNFIGVLPIMNIMYQINTDAIYIDVNRFRLSHPGCASEVSYKIYVNEVSINQQPRTFLKFNENTNQLIISTSLGRDRGNYKVKITASIGGSESMSVQFHLTIVNQDFINIIKKPIETQIQPNSSTGDVIIFKDLNAKYLYRKVNLEVLVLSPELLQFYQDASKVASNLIVQEQIMFGKIKKIDSKAKMTFQFQTNIDKILSQKLIKRDFNIHLHRNPSSDNPQIELVYFEVLKISSNQVELQLKFEDQKLISISETFDEIEVKLVKGSTSHKLLSLLYIQKLKSKVSSLLQASQDVPRQLSQDDQEFIEAFDDAATASVMIAFGLCFLLNTFLALSLQHLWGAMNAFQIISHLPLVTINLPANTVGFFSVILEISAFQLYPTDFINTFFEIDEDDQSPFSMYFEGVGYDTMNIFLNLGMLMVTIYITALYYILYFTLEMILPKILFDEAAQQNKFLKLLSKFLNWSKQKLIYACVLTLLIEAYFEIGLSSMLNLYDLRYKGFSDIAASFHSIILVSIILCFPFISAHFLNKHHEKLENEVFAAKYETFYEGLRLDSKIASQYQILNMLRKLIQILAFMIFDEYTFLQFFTLIFTSLGMIMYIILVEPFDDKFIHKMELFNEFTVIAIMYSMLCFSEINQNDETKYDLGYFPIAIFALNFSVHLLNLIIRGGFNIKDTIVQLFKKLRAKFCQNNSLPQNNIYQFNGSDDEKFSQHISQLESSEKVPFTFGQNGKIAIYSLQSNFKNNTGKQQNPRKKRSLMHLPTLNQKKNSNNRDQIEVVDLTSKEYKYENVQEQSIKTNSRQKRIIKRKKQIKSKNFNDFDQISTMSPSIFKIKNNHKTPTKNQQIQYL